MAAAATSDDDAGAGLDAEGLVAALSDAGSPAEAGAEGEDT